MDLKLTTTAVINNNQENDVLLNAIKNKFTAKAATEAAAFSPPKFNIPVLKIPGATETIANKDKSEQNSEEDNSIQLNQFLLKQLQEQHKTNGLNKSQAGFALPNLKLGNTLTNREQQMSVKFESPALKINNKSVSSLTSALNKLQVEETSKNTIVPTTSQDCFTIHPAIDLTSALASKLQNHQQNTPPTRDLKKSSTGLSANEDVNFEIPFIDCDHIDISRKYTILLTTSNEYCITDISQLRLNPSLVEPSAIGRFLNTNDNKYTEPLPLKYFSIEFEQQSVKHNIEPFHFNTKSPDDLVLETLNKYQRRYYN